VREALVNAARQRDDSGVAVVRAGCLGLCGAGPAVVTYPAGAIHLHVEPGDAADLAKELASGSGLKRRQVRAPQWYRDHILSRLATFVRLLQRRAAAIR
jgi:(2Fe-2S) ferredoxin